jgi:hypothetical protein
MCIQQIVLVLRFCAWARTARLIVGCAATGQIRGGSVDADGADKDEAEALDQRSSLRGQFQCRSLEVRGGWLHDRFKRWRSYRCDPVLGTSRRQARS